MSEETVNPQEEVVQDMVEAAAEPEVAPAESEVEQESVKEEQVPLSALKKERRKRQELEQELQWERQRLQQHVQPEPQSEEDLSKYESATKEELKKSQLETQEAAVRAVEERLWIKQNQEKYEKVNENLQQFLKQRPNLASAIGSASNRWEEAYTLMEALTPREQQKLKSASSPKKEAPHSPSGVPKTVAMNQAVDVMSMSDSEFAAWRQSQKKRR